MLALQKQLPFLFSEKVPNTFDESVIEDCLRAQGRLEDDNHVTNVEQEHLSGHEGNSGTVLRRLRISYSKSQERPPPETMVLKLSDTSKLKGPSQRDSAMERLILYSAGMSDVNMLQREALFYGKFHEMVSDPCGVKTPEIYYTAISGHTNLLTRTLFVLFKRKEHMRGAILMEDLSTGRNLDAVENCPREVLEGICTEIGRLYGYTAKTLVENNNAGPVTRLPKAFTYQMCLMSAGVSRLVKRRWKPSSNMVHKVIMRWGHSDYQLLRDDQEVQQALLALEQNFYPRVYKLHQTLQEYQCVVQGDMHAGNFMLMPDGTMKMFDMQMWGIGHPAEEICYFLASNVDPTPEADDLALQRVHTAMETASQGLVKYPLERLKRDVEICTLHYMAACIVRRGQFETPETVARLKKKLGSCMGGIERVMSVREQRLMLRTRQIWKRDPTFAFAEPSKLLQPQTLIASPTLSSAPTVVIVNE